MHQYYLQHHLEKLTYFAIIAETGSFSAAAQRLRISQPALSRSVKALEEILSTTLFLRDRHGARLTVAGDKLFQATKSMLAIIRETEAQIRQADPTTQVTLELGTKDPFVIHLWPRFMAYLNKQSDPVARDFSQNIWLSVDKQNAVLWNRLITNKIDLILLVEPPKDKSVAAIALFQSDMRLYKAGRAARARYGISQNLLEQPLLCYRNAIINVEATLRNFISKDSTSRRIIDLQSFDGARQMAVRGLGICMLPQWIAHEDLEENLLEELPMQHLGKKRSPIPKSTVYLCANAKTAAIPAFASFAKSFRQFARAEFES